VAKTTLILMIAGLIRPSRGDLVLKGQTITAPRRENRTSPAGLRAFPLENRSQEYRPGRQNPKKHRPTLGRSWNWRKN
jgi:ABC-type branched-subunit amino acid transport system ATPase component